MGAIGVTGGTAANALAAEADLVVAVGTRLSDFTTASRSLFRNPSVALVQLNAAGFDAAKHGALSLVADARTGLDALDRALATWAAPADWTTKARSLAAEWNETVTQATASSNAALPSDAQVLGAVNRAAGPRDVIVCAAGGLPGELHKLWRCPEAGAYHVEYGYSCMGYEIAGGLGVKLAMPDREVWVLVGDGSYLMMNSEIATSVMLDKKLNIVRNGSGVDFAGHAASLGAISRKVASLAELEGALPEARAERRTSVIVIATDPTASTGAGGAWWDVAVPEVSSRAEVALARAAYDAARSQQRFTS
jgi:3D-(3,5/4)-trihydroxycyclohexane-1,2-dione acylhydrolase (decyclizing)